MMPVGAGGGAAFPGPRVRRAGQRGSDGRARRAGRPRGRWGRRLSASGRAGVGGVAGPGTRPPQSCWLRGAAVCLAPPGERPVPRFPLGAVGVLGDGTRVRCSHARNPRFPCTGWNTRLARIQRAILGIPLPRLPRGYICSTWSDVPVT